MLDRYPIQRFAYFTSLIRPKRKIWRGYIGREWEWKACISRSIRVRVLLFQRFDAFASGFIVSIL